MYLVGAHLEVRAIRQGHGDVHSPRTRIDDTEGLGGVGGAYAVGHERSLGIFNDDIEVGSLIINVETGHRVDADTCRGSEAVAELSAFLGSHRELLQVVAKVII